MKKTTVLIKLYLIGSVMAAAGCLTGACTAYAAESGQEIINYQSCPQIEPEDYPVMDCSLACVPLCEKIAMMTTGCSENEAEDSIVFSNTNPSYLALARGDRDIIISYEASDGTKEKLQEYDPIELTPIGKDALVFLVNVKNPIDSLTTEQIQDIYSGKITNWKEVGGEEQEIIPFQRPEDSGSQTLMRRLLMQDREMMDPEKYLISGMEGLIESVASFDGGEASIGFSVYYYASDMMANENVKLIRVDEIQPSNESIKDGSYTLINQFYCGITESSSEEAVMIRDWLISDEGQDLIEECGYVSEK